MTLEQLIGPSWAKVLEGEFAKPYMKQVMQTVKSEKQKGFTILPESENIFKAYHLTPFEEVKAVIIGQDPYHTIGRGNIPAAHGLAFSVTEEYAGQNTLPPSLKNILTLLEEDSPSPPWEVAISPDLTHWAKQGVLLLNTALTVRQAQAGSHSSIGWSNLIEATLKSITEPSVYIAWGSHARSVVEPTIDILYDRYITAPHPSPLSAYRGFFNHKPFSEANKWLKERGKTEIKWI